ncbi:MAG: hypothetical protein ACLPJH_18590 [Myxococcaceae bacterium]
MPPTARPTASDAADGQPGRRWWLRGLLWWALALVVLVVAVRECT